MILIEGQKRRIPMKGIPSPMRDRKGIPSPMRDRTFEEIYGLEKAQEMKKKLSFSVGKLWENEEHRKKMIESHKR